MALNGLRGKSINCECSYRQPITPVSKELSCWSLLHFYQLGSARHDAIWAAHRPLQSEPLAFMGLLNFAQGTDSAEQEANTSSFQAEDNEGQATGLGECHHPLSAQALTNQTQNSAAPGQSLPPMHLTPMAQEMFAHIGEVQMIFLLPGCPEYT